MKKNYKWSLVSLLIIVALAFSACAAPADTESADRILNSKPNSLLLLKVM